MEGEIMETVVLNLESKEKLDNNSIEKLLKDADLRKNMGENGWKRFKSDFTLEAFEKRMEFCLKKALK